MSKPWVKLETPLALRRDYDDETCEELPSFQHLDTAPVWAVPGVALYVEWDDGVRTVRHVGHWNANLGACDCCSPDRKVMILAYRLPEDTEPPCFP